MNREDNTIFHLRISLSAAEDTRRTVRGAAGLGALDQDLLHQGLERVLHLQVLLGLQKRGTMLRDMM